jgi:RND family efflux transporter MFP subunit
MLFDPIDSDPVAPSPKLSALRIHQDARPQRRRRKAPWLIPLVILLVLAAGAYLLRERYLGVAPRVQAALVTRVGGAGERAVLTANGYVTARRQAGVTPKVTGRIKKLYRDLGDTVSKGEVIVELEDADVLAALEEAKAVHWVSQLEAERARKLAEDKVGTQSEHDLAVAKAKETAARVKNLEEQVENTKVRAPFDGKIIVKNGEVGETVSLFGAQTSRKSGPIFVIADFHEFEVEADVNEANIGKLSAGQPAAISLDAVPERTYKGSLRQLVPTADRQKATVQAKVSILDLDERVLPDLSAKVTFLKDDSATEPVRVVAPAAGVVERGGRTVVFLLEGDRVREVPVEVGAGEAGRVVVSSGLTGGESIVLSPPSDLESGGRVRIKDTP